ncbi:MAG: hypothetical protein L0Z62_21030 [Gemmataceae bacterium]|nr:hypothetical protein [Gemmataceae bacterium]
MSILNGTWLASGGDDRKVKVWDATAGLEVLRLGGHTGSVRAMAFNRAGTQLASAGRDGTVKIWDGRPWTPEAAVEREALGRLDFLFSKPLCQADVLEHLQSALLLHPQARQMALELVKHYRGETDPDRYHQASWAVVRQPYLNAFQYGFALQQAKAASQLAPDQAEYRTVLGVAQYRLGRYPDALATLTRPDRMSAGSPAELAFLAMPQHRLGQTEQAQATLARFRETMRKLKWAQNGEAQAFLREAETLTGGKPAVPQE